MRAAEAARSKTASEKTGEAISFGVEALAPIAAGVVFFAGLAAGPPGWILLIVLFVAMNGSGSSSNRSRKPKVTGFYSPYAPKR